MIEFDRASTLLSTCTAEVDIENVGLDTFHLFFLDSNK